MAEEPAWSEWSSILIEAAAYILRMESRHIFGACFCEEGDLLSQWRGYADGGIAISFIYDSLSQIVNPQGFHLYKCNYDDKEQEAISRHFIEKVCSDDRPKAEETEHFIGNLGEILLIVSAFFKNKAFKEEQEWRLVSKGAIGSYDGRRGFQARGKNLVPYCKVDLGSKDPKKDHNGHDCLSFDEMIAGPRNSRRDYKLLADAFTYLCFSKKIRCVTVRESQIPYRA
jgi:Protein of unknown function (DUF2971)